MRLCRAVDLSTTDENEARLARLLTPAAKYWICKAAPAFCLGSPRCPGKAFDFSPVSEPRHAPPVPIDDHQRLGCG